MQGNTVSLMTMQSILGIINYQGYGKKKELQ